MSVLNTVTLTWDFTDLIQSGETAALSIAPTALLTDVTDGETVVEVPRLVKFTGGTGQLAGIVANDNTAITPTGTGYTITVTTEAGQVIYSETVVIAYANGATQHLASLTPAQTVTAMAAYLTGSYPGGPGGAAEWLSGDGTWTAPTAAQVGADASGAAAAAVTTETTRAEGAESVNATAISTETTRAEAAEAAAVSTAEGHTLALAATTGLNGYTLANGTGAILTWTAPSDGQPHRVLLAGQMNVTSTETGGQIQASFTLPNGTATTLQVAGGGLATGARAFSNTVLSIAPGTTVTISQSSALTGGAATLFLDLLAL